MTQEEQDAVIGRIVRERRDCQAKLAALEAEAKRLGETFSSMGTLLQYNPHKIAFEGHPAPPELYGTGLPLFQQSDIMAAKIIKLVDDIRETQRNLKSLESKARAAGV